MCIQTNKIYIYIYFAKNLYSPDSVSQVLLARQSLLVILSTQGKPNTVCFYTEMKVAIFHFSFFIFFKFAKGKIWRKDSENSPLYFSPWLQVIKVLLLSLTDVIITFDNY